MSLLLKKTTNLTGIPVAENAKQQLIVLYGKIMKELVKMPESSMYRKHTEEIIKHRCSVVNKEEDFQKIEQKIGCGQIEELLIQAKNELNLARRLSGYKVWEPLKEPIPTNQWKWPIN